MLRNVFSQSQPKTPIPPSMKKRWLRLKNLGKDIGSPERAFLAANSPPNAAAFVTTEDVDGDGIVDVIRFNPQVVNRYYEGLEDPMRFDAIDKYIRQLRDEEKKHQNLESAVEASAKLLEEINNADPKAYQDFQKTIAADIWLFVTIVHELTHLHGQKEKGEFHDEDKARASEAESKRIVSDRIYKDLPEILKRDDNIMRQLGFANDKVAYIKKILKVAEMLDAKGQYSLADKIDQFAEEFLNEYRY